MRAAIAKLALPLVFLAVALPAGVGAVMMMGDPEGEDDSAFVPISRTGEARNERHAQPRWERVAQFAGQGSAERSFAIAPAAIQWRIQWRCTSGDFRMSVGRPSQDAQVLAARSCPDVGVETSTGKGSGKLQVTATGRWQVTVRQQVDTALEEPRLSGMTDASMLARGRFHRVQKHGEGTVELHRLPSGRLALRFQDFYTAASPGLRVWLSRAPNVKSTLDARQAKYRDAGVIRSTLGSYNQMLPADVDADEVRTIVIWCPTVLIAFSAAPLSTT
ncbi:MAG TPA: DM13 domain-containing protein [Solirubrobacteraceae bacterium]|nr:DM13 domain-containing protein [Solirubrobacteraceae bacterium]